MLTPRKFAACRMVAAQQIQIQGCLSQIALKLHQSGLVEALAIRKADKMMRDPGKPSADRLLPLFLLQTNASNQESLVPCCV